MRNLSLLFILFSGFVNYLFAQKNDIPEKLDNSLLWEISGKGIKKSYIFGTIHLIAEKDYFLEEKTIQAIHKSKKMVMEIDMNKMMDNSLKMLSLAPMKGKKLKDLISPEDYELIKKYFSEDSKNPEVKMLPFSMIENWKPMFLQSFLYQDMIEGPAKTYEMELLAIGSQRKMSFDGLETIEDQINVFEKIPYEDQAKVLLESIKNIQSGENEGKNEFKKLTDLYKSQNIEEMITQSGEDLFGDMKNAEEELLIKRNSNWIPKIKEFSKKKPVFYAVGAAHLGGPNGVLRLLMKEGFTVKAL